MSKIPILYWPHETKGNTDYQLSRKVINNITGLMPEIILDDLDISTVFAEKKDAVIYYPVLCGSTGWWGELLGSDGIISEKIIDLLI